MALNYGRLARRNEICESVEYVFNYPIPEINVSF